jgi:hypothetical protein
VSDYVGYWLECHNRKCGFPIRVPAPPAKLDKRYTAFHFACPVCLHVNRYTLRDLRRVRFRSPDPYQAGKLVLYSVQFGCAHPRCAAEGMVFTAAAANVSVALLLQFWKTWNVKFNCKGKHRFRMLDPRTWWIQREKSFTQALR